MAKPFAVIYSCSADVALQDATRPLHLEHLRRLIDDGTLVASGPWGQDDVRGGLLIFHAHDRAAVQAIVGSDPFMSRGWWRPATSVSGYRCLDPRLKR